MYWPTADRDWWHINAWLIFLHALIQHRDLNWSKLKRIVMRLQNIIGIILHQMKSGSRRRAINFGSKNEPSQYKCKDSWSFQQKHFDFSMHCHLSPIWFIVAHFLLPMLLVQQDSKDMTQWSTLLKESFLKQTLLTIELRPQLLNRILTYSVCCYG